MARKKVSKVRVRKIRDAKSAARSAAKSAAKSATAAQAHLLDAMHQIWLAGLGAVSRAQHGAPKLLDELVKEGARVHAKGRRATEGAVRGALEAVQGKIGERIGNVREQATDAYEDLEKMFQTRVHRAMHHLGVPSAEEVSALSKRVEKLSANVAKLARTGTGAPSPAAAARDDGEQARPAPGATA
jgi:poly(hydroxyalkanoate) granule-associated protein